MHLDELIPQFLFQNGQTQADAFAAGSRMRSLSYRVGGTVGVCVCVQR